MCNSCEALTINGVYCHEIGCPDAWQDETRECRWCGREFKLEEKHQTCCDDSCYAAYNGLPMPDDYAEANDDQA
jgi:hypothetical protein